MVKYILRKKSHGDWGVYSSKWLLFVFWSSGECLAFHIAPYTCGIPCSNKPGALVALAKLPSHRSRTRGCCSFCLVVETANASGDESWTMTTGLWGPSPESTRATEICSAWPAVWYRPRRRRRRWTTAWRRGGVLRRRGGGGARCRRLRRCRLYHCCARCLSSLRRTCWFYFFFSYVFSSQFQNMLNLWMLQLAPEQFFSSIVTSDFFLHLFFITSTWKEIKQTKNILSWIVHINEEIWKHWHLINSQNQNSKATKNWTPHSANNHVLLV